MQTFSTKQTIKTTTQIKLFFLSAFSKLRIDDVIEVTEVDCHLVGEDTNHKKILLISAQTVIDPTHIRPNIAILGGTEKCSVGLTDQNHVQI